MYCFFYRVLNGYINIDISSFIKFYSRFERYPLRGRDDLTMKTNYVRTDTSKYSFFHMIFDKWNVLPLSVRQASSISGFKKGARDYLTSRNV